MGDLIRRCDVLDNINKRIYYFDKASLDEAIKAVYNAPSVDATPRWIPVEERLPEEKSLVLIYWIDHIFEATYLWDGNFETLNKELLLAGRDFTHWMPLPEPPKED